MSADEIRTDDRMRANTYGLLAALLRAPPRGDVLDRLRSVPAAADPTAPPLARAWAALGAAAREASPEDLDDEFHDLFIGLGRGELVPFASWYRAGRLLDQPLVRLRSDLAALGLGRCDGVPEPEDHAAAVCEAMALLVLSGSGGRVEQGRFFAVHLGPWMFDFLRDLRAAHGASFFRAVGELGGAFLEVERIYLDADDPGFGREDGIERRDRWHGPRPGVRTAGASSGGS